MISFENRTDDKFISYNHGLTFVPHIHHNIELMICIEGKIETMCNFKSQILHKGDMMIAFANNVHSYHNIDQCTCIMCIINHDILTALTPYFNKKSNNFFYIGGGNKIVNLAKGLYTEYENDRNKEIMIGYLYVILGMAFKRFDFSDVKSTVEDKIFTKVLIYISENYKNEITLKSAAYHFGISNSYLSRLFAENLNCGFCKYIHELRINYSKKLLRESKMSIENISFECGFSTQRTFNRVFFELSGMTPREYTNNNLTKIND